MSLGVKGRPIWLACPLGQGGVGREAMWLLLLSFAVLSSKGTNRGVSTSPSQKAKILEAVASLEGAGKGTVTTSSQDVDGTWKLLWTTEKVKEHIDL
jgi:hypothetical protein